MKQVRLHDNIKLSSELGSQLFINLTDLHLKLYNELDHVLYNEFHSVFRNVLFENR